MIEIKSPDEPFEGIEEIKKQKAEREDEINKLLNPDAYYMKEINKSLNEINKTLKEILREMRKRK